MYEQIKKEAAEATKELIEISGITAGDILVIGCSSSEIVGETIGKNSDIDAARAAFDGIYPILKEKGIFLAAQCCEHLNRAIVIEREAAKKYGFEIVCVVPQKKAGGSFATTAYANFSDPCVVEYVKADAGMDIGDTLIGMHLKHVAVPVRLKTKKIGKANLVAARTRPKLIGGERAVYQ
ncbi:MAG: TIGR01440 family protein [Clostridia bacterium]|nr:TIGR01440 family protein [Clostridia bacterium]